MIRRPPRSTQSRSSAASDVYKRQQAWTRRTTRSSSRNAARRRRLSWGRPTVRLFAARGQCHLQDLGQVKGVAAAGLGDLLAAAEAVGDELGVGGGGADRWQEGLLADLHRQLV